MTPALNQNPLRQQGVIRAGCFILRKLLVLCVLTAALGGPAGCGNDSGVKQNNNGISNKSAVTNESPFNRRPAAGSKNLGMAYQEGFTAGRNSTTDFNMNWMKNWDKDAEWRTGYDRGWKDGRNLRKMQDERSTRAGDN